MFRGLTFLGHNVKHKQQQQHAIMFWKKTCGVNGTGSSTDLMPFLSPNQSIKHRQKQKALTPIKENCPLTLFFRHPAPLQLIPNEMGLAPLMPTTSVSFFNTIPCTLNRSVLERRLHTATDFLASVGSLSSTLFSSLQCTVIQTHCLECGCLTVISLDIIHVVLDCYSIPEIRATKKDNKANDKTLQSTNSNNNNTE